MKFTNAVLATAALIAYPHGSDATGNTNLRRNLLLKKILPSTQIITAPVQQVLSPSSSGIITDPIQQVLSPSTSEVITNPIQQVLSPSTSEVITNPIQQVLSPSSCPTISFDFDQLDWGMWVRDQFKETHGITIEAKAKTSSVGWTPDISGKASLEWGALRVFDTYRPKGSLGGSELCCSASNSTDGACLFGNNSHTDDGNDFLGFPKVGCTKQIIQDITGLATDIYGNLWRSPGQCKCDDGSSAENDATNSHQDWAHCSPKGNVLCIQESNKVCPDGTDNGGWIKITFTNPTKLKTLLALDIDFSVANGVTVVDVDGNILSSTLLNQPGSTSDSPLLALQFGLTTTVLSSIDLSVDLDASLDIGLANVKTVLIELGGTGSLKSIDYEYCPPVEPVCSNCPVGWWLLEHFSLFTAKDLIELGTVEGRAFVGGRLQLESGLEVGVGLSNFTASPTLYVAGGLASDVTTAVNGIIKVAQGGLAHPGLCNYEYESKHWIRRREIDLLHVHGSLHAQSDLVALSAKYQVQLGHVSDYLATLPNQVVVNVDASASLVLKVQSLYNGCAVFMIQGSILAGGNVQSIIFDKGTYAWHEIDLIIVNVEGTSITWDSAASIDLTVGWLSASVDANISLGFNSGASKLIWNFNQATWLHFANTIIGTTLAPKAHLTVDANVYGGVFVKSLTSTPTCNIRLPSFKAKCPFGASTNLIDGSVVVPPTWVELDHITTFANLASIGGWTKGVVGDLTDSALVTNLYCPGTDNSCWCIKREGGVNTQVYKEFDILGDATTFKVKFDFFAKGMEGSDKFKIQTQCTNYYPGYLQSTEQALTTSVVHAEFSALTDFVNFVVHADKEVVVRVPPGCQKMKILFECIGNSLSETVFLDNIHVFQLNYDTLVLENFISASASVWMGGGDNNTYSHPVAGNASITLHSGVPCWQISGKYGWASTLYANLDGGILAGISKVAVVFDFRTTGFATGDFVRLGYQCSCYDAATGSYGSSSSVYWVHTWEVGASTSLTGSSSGSSTHGITDGQLYLDEMAELTIQPGTCDRLQIRFENHGGVDVQSKFTVLGNVEVLYHY